MIVCAYFGIGDEHVFEPLGAVEVMGREWHKFVGPDAEVSANPSLLGERLCLVIYAGF